MTKKKKQRSGLQAKRKRHKPRRVNKSTESVAVGRVRKVNPSLSRAARKAHPKTAEQYFARGERFRATWNLVTEVVAKMRGKGLSLQRASQEAGTSPRTVLRWGRLALRKDARGRFVAKRTDRLLRVLRVPTANGPLEVAVRNSSQATLLSEYWIAVHNYLETGEATGLAKFKGRFIRDTGGTKIQLLTDLDQLKSLGSAGVLSFHSIYAESH